MEVEKESQSFQYNDEADMDESLDQTGFLLQRLQELQAWQQEQEIQLLREQDQQIGRLCNSNNQVRSVLKCFNLKHYIFLDLEDIVVLCGKLITEVLSNLTIRPTSNIDHHFEVPFGFNNIKWPVNNDHLSTTATIHKNNVVIITEKLNLIYDHLPTMFPYLTITCLEA